MTDDLVKRLNEGVHRPATQIDCDEVDSLMEEAADRIEALEARIAKADAVKKEEEPDKKPAPWHTLS